MNPQEIRSCKDHLAVIQRLAQERWGTELNYKGRPTWESKLVNAYVELVRHQPGNEKATLANRRGHILRAFEKGSCAADTLISLYAAVDCRIEVVREQRVV